MVSPMTTTAASADPVAATAAACCAGVTSGSVGTETTFPSTCCIAFRVVVAGGIWSGGPAQQAWRLLSNTPCQLTLQPPSWAATESASGPVTTTFAVGDSGSEPSWLRRSVLDCYADWPPSDW